MIFDMIKDMSMDELVKHLDMVQQIINKRREVEKVEREEAKKKIIEMFKEIFF